MYRPALTCAFVKSPASKVLILHLVLEALVQSTVSVVFASLMSFNGSLALLATISKLVTVNPSDSNTV